MEMKPEEYDRIAQLISSDASPVGIDAKKTHVYIIHMLQNIQQRLVAIERQVAEIRQERVEPD